MESLTDFWRRKPAATVAIAIAMLVLVRIICVIATPLEIGPDEAQYWRWSRTLDWGYYSKPPLIAWAIAFTTGLFGNGEWAIRLSAPVAHGFAGFFLFMLGRSAFDARVGAWSAAVYLLMPGVWLSSAVISTDALLLPLWAASMLCLWRLRDQATLLNGALLGVALGLAMLAKYAALYLFIGALLAAIIDKPTRRALLSLSGLAALVAFIAVLAPNLIWNAANKFETLSHTTDNANWNNATFDFGHLGQFVLDQMGVFGPLTFLALAAGAVMLIRPSAGETFRRELWLASFIAPPLLVIVVQAVISRAHANWAATAYPAAAILLASWIARPRWGLFIKAATGLNVAVGLVFLVAWTLPSIGDAGGAANAYKRVRGWREATIALQKLAAQDGATALMFDDREVWHGVDYYGRKLDIPPVRAWRRGDEPHSYAEGAGTIRPGEDGKVLVASVVPAFREMIKADFDTIEPAGDLVIPLGPKRKRVLKLFLASGYHPKPRTPDFEAKYHVGNDD